MDETTEPVSAGRLFLLPVTLTDGGRPDCVMPVRNLDIARNVKHFIVENVRTARRFLKRCDPGIDIGSLTFVVLDKHTAPEDVDAMLSPLAAGEDMAVMSEAGCPAVADPGALAVAAAHRHGYRVEPLVGPSSILMGLMASGFNGQSFAFNGYLPVADGERQQRLRELEKRIRHDDQTQIFIETPYRNNRLIASLTRMLPGNLRLCVACDLTGRDESVRVMTLKQWASATYDFDKRPAIFLLYK